MMFTHYRTQGFIFKKTDRGEADRIFTIFAKDFGKLDLLAKAERKIKSKLRAGLEVFYLSEIEFIQGKTHKTLTDAILIDNFKNLRSNLKKLATAYKISETLNDLVKGQEPDKKIWQLLQETFDKLDNPRILAAKYQILYHYFIWNLLLILGYELEVYNCVLCGKKITPKDIFFSPKEGGLLCSECGKTTKSVKEIDQSIVKIIRLFIKKDWSTLNRLKTEPEDLRQISVISKCYLSQILEQTR